MTKYFAEMLVILGAFMSPLVGVVGAMLAFVMVDLVTGIMKARHIALMEIAHKDLSSKERLTHILKRVNSRKMSHSVAKFIFYLSGIVLAHIANYQLALNMPLVKMVLGFIIVIELKSIDENMRIVLGYSIFTKFLDIIKRSEDDR